MKSRFLIAILLIVGSACLSAQQVVTSRGSAQEELTREKSRIDVEKIVRERASVDALERAFGRVIIQGNSTYISNLQTGQKVETNTVFRTIANTSVKGEIIEVISEKFTDLQGFRVIDGEKRPVTEIKCDIEVRAREITTPPVKFTSSPLACLNEKCMTTSFKNNDTLFFFFTSPVSGYLTIYLDDQSNTFCLYPYKNMPAKFEGGVPVSSDQKYFLFSDKPEYNYFLDSNIIPDTYQLDAISAQDMNRIFVIFSKNPMNKPSLRDESGKLLGQKDLDRNYRLPKSLRSEDFQKWLNNYRSAGKSDVQVQIIDITITK